MRELGAGKLPRSHKAGGHSKPGELFLPDYRLSKRECQNVLPVVGHPFPLTTDN
jgi:hypothetical protein